MPFGGASELGVEFVRRPIGTTKAVLRRLAEIPSRGLPSLGRQTIDEFDKRRGVDTSRIVRIVATDSANAKHGNRYQASDEAVVRWFVDHCRLRLEATTFIDFGSGKGRPLIVAADYPFKAIVGVEYSPDLVAICRKNLDILGLRDRIRLVLGDATAFQPPAGPILAFFYNPFAEPVHRAVLENLAKAPGPVVIGHYGPGQETVIAAGGRRFESAPASHLYALSRAAQAQPSDSRIEASAL